MLTGASRNSRGRGRQTWITLAALSAVVVGAIVAAIVLTAPLPESRLSARPVIHYTVLPERPVSRASDAA